MTGGDDELLQAIGSAYYAALECGTSPTRAVLDVLHAHGYRRCAEGQRTTQWCDRANKAEAEVERLRELNAEWERKASAWMASPEAAQRLDGYRELAQRLNAAEAERDALRADAERYRWLRENGSNSRVTEKDGFGGYCLKYYDDLDAAIDAARGGDE